VLHSAADLLSAPLTHRAKSFFSPPNRAFRIFTPSSNGGIWSGGSWEVHQTISGSQSLSTLGSMAFAAAVSASPGAGSRASVVAAGRSGLGSGALPGGRGFRFASTAAVATAKSRGTFFVPWYSRIGGGGGGGGVLRAMSVGMVACIGGGQRLAGYGRAVGGGAGAIARRRFSWLAAPGHGYGRGRAGAVEAAAGAPGTAGAAGAAGKSSRAPKKSGAGGRGGQRRGKSTGGGGGGGSGGGKKWGKGKKKFGTAVQKGLNGAHTLEVPTVGPTGRRLLTRADGNLNTDGKKVTGIAFRSAMKLLGVSKKHFIITTHGPPHKKVFSCTHVIQIPASWAELNLIPRYNRKARVRPKL